jgi:acetoin utilization deacetylase AcuC-like enzyme
MKVFYRSEQVGPVQHSSPSAHKPRVVLDDWVRSFGPAIEVIGFEPATEQQFGRAHDPAFVRDVLAANLPNGFGNRDPKVAASLPYTTGSMVAAAEYAVLHNTVVCSPTSGFHHAGYRQAGGYCTFNGLMVTAMAIKDAGLVNRVAILDCDAHYGNGTDEIISALDIDWIEHHTLGEKFGWSGTAVNGAFETWLDRAIDKCSDCDLVLYQAGADPHVNDPLGGLLTTAQMAARDRAVFERLGHLPMVWNLAGGYQVVTGSTEAERIEPVLALHRTTARLHCEMFG